MLCHMMSSWCVATPCQSVVRFPDPCSHVLVLLQQVPWVLVAMSTMLLQQVYVSCWPCLLPAVHDLQPFGIKKVSHAAYIVAVHYAYCVHVHTHTHTLYPNAQVFECCSA
jgi:hypothetical protein